MINKRCNSIYSRFLWCAFGLSGIIGAGNIPCFYRAGSAAGKDQGTVVFGNRKTLDIV